MTKETTTTKNRKNLISSTKAEQKRIIIRVIISIKTLKKNISRSIIIAKEKTKKKAKRKIIKQSKKISLRLLIEFYQNSKCSSKYQRQKRR